MTKEIKAIESIDENNEAEDVINVIQSESGELVVSSKDVAEHFGKRHDNVLRDINNLNGGDLLNFEEMFLESSSTDGYGRDQKIYLMNRDGFTLLAMGFTGKKAMTWKLKYIDAFNKMEKYIKEKNMDSYMIEDPIKRAKRWIEERLERDKLDAQVKELIPKAEFHDAVTGSKDCILVGEMAKLIKQNGVDMGQRRLFDWLRSNGYLMKSGRNYNLPTQESMERGWFEIKEGFFGKPGGKSQLFKTPLITGKGQVYFMKKFLKKKAD